MHAAIPPVPPCMISARCALRLKIASIAYHYYEDIGRDITAQNMNYTSVLKSFYLEYESIIKLSKEDRPDVPQLSKHQTPIKMMESFKDCLHRTFGVRMCPVIYVIRSDSAVPTDADDPLDLANGNAFSVESGTVLNELIMRLSHQHSLYRCDNNLVYSLLDEATRGTIYAPTIKPYARTKDGRKAWQAIVSSHAGTDKWEQIMKDRLKFLMATKWNGKTYSLEKFTGLHRSAYGALEEASQHVNFQLPTEHSRVTYLLDNITNTDPDLRAALASVRANINNMRDNFELAVGFILPVCPYIKHRVNHRQATAQISDATLRGRSHSKSGVEFRWHKKAEYAKLNSDQRKELWE